MLIRFLILYIAWDSQRKVLPKNWGPTFCSMEKIAVPTSAILGERQILQILILFPCEWYIRESLCPTIHAAMINLTEKDRVYFLIECQTLSKAWIIYLWDHVSGVILCHTPKPVIWSSMIYGISQFLKQTITLFKANFDKNRIHPPVFSWFFHTPQILSIHWLAGLWILNNRRYGIAIERKLRENKVTFCGKNHRS